MDLSESGIRNKREKIRAGLKTNLFQIPAKEEEIDPLEALQRKVIKKDLKDIDPMEEIKRNEKESEGNGVIEVPDDEDKGKEREEEKINPQDHEVEYEENDDDDDEDDLDDLYDPFKEGVRHSVFFSHTENELDVLKQDLGLDEEPDIHFI